MRKVTVLIVDDSLLMRRLFSRLLEDVPDIEVIGTAADAQDAREKIKRLNPDVLTLDVEMPGMDGLSFLEKIMALRPMPVVMLSTLTHRGTEVSIRALEIGAVDCVGKPSGPQSDASLDQFRELLIAKIHLAARVRKRLPVHAPHTLRPLKFEHFSDRIIAIGSSTGGVEALRDIFSLLPANAPPVVMAQHMPALFTASLAARLNSISQVRVAEAHDGAKLEQGHAWLAPGGRHLRVVRRANGLFCRLEDGPAISGHKPSVDALFDSVAQAAGEKAVGVILTGMGKDGAQGMLQMRQKGGYTIGQNEASCVVYGMPRAAAATGAVTVELPLHEIAAHMLQECAVERVL